jgi:hypothetical protein
LSAANELAIGFCTRGGAAVTYSGVSFTQGAETSPEPSASGMDSSTGSSSGENLHSGSLAITSTTGQAYSGTASVQASTCGIIVIA